MCKPGLRRESLIIATGLAAQHNARHRRRWSLDFCLDTLRLCHPHRCRTPGCCTHHRLPLLNGTHLQLSWTQQQDGCSLRQRHTLANLLDSAARQLQSWAAVMMMYTSHCCTQSMFKRGDRGGMGAPWPFPKCEFLLGFAQKAGEKRAEKTQNAVQKRSCLDPF